MAQYYFDKYQAVQSYGSQSSWPWELEGTYGFSNGNYAMSIGADSSGFVLSNTNSIYQNSNYSDHPQYDPVSVTNNSPRATPGVTSAYTGSGGFVYKYVYDSVKYSDYDRKNIMMWKKYNLMFSKLSPSYVRGALVQSGVILESTIYPGNGRYSDGYWYVRGAEVNTAPSTPGAFTAPTGVLEIGDSKVISWGASSDAHGNLKNYVLEASINNGAWAQIATPTTNSFTYTIPTATSVKFRVKAVDTPGLQSAYRESSLFTVSKPMYYWSKYSVAKRIQVDYHNWGNVFIPFGNPMQPAIDVNPTTLAVTLRGNTEYVQEGSWLRKDWFVIVSGTIIKLDSTGSTAQAGGYTTGSSKPIPSEVSERGTLVQSNITAIEGTYSNNGKHTDGYWYVRGSRVSQSIAPPDAFTSPAQNALLSPKQSLSLTFGASSAPNLSTYEVEHRYNEGAWTSVGTHSNALTRPFTVTENKTLTKVEFRVRAKNTSNVYSDYVYSESFIIEHNRVPTITLNTENNVTLYENDTFKIDGSGLDLDIGDILNVYYRINGGASQAIATGISKGASIPFNEQLLFKGGVLYEGATAVTDALAEGPAHRLEVWSEDNQGGKSTIAERTFYVVPNHAPSLTVDPFTDQSGMIDNDTIKFLGVSSDPDGNDVTVKYRVNEQVAVQIHSGAAGPWSFDLSFKLLKDGENTIVVEVTDTHNFKSSKTIKLNKTVNLTPLASSTQRYTIVPPSGTAQGVLLWIQRDADQEVTAEISMTIGTEQEQFVPLTLDSTVPMGEDVEDYFKYRADTPAEHIALKLSWTGDKPITFISGALLQ